MGLCDALKSARNSVKNLLLSQSTEAHALRAAHSNRYSLEVGWLLGQIELGLSRTVMQDTTRSTQRPQSLSSLSSGAL